MSFVTLSRCCLSLSPKFQFHIPSLCIELKGHLELAGVIAGEERIWFVSLQCNEVFCLISAFDYVLAEHPRSPFSLMLCRRFRLFCDSAGHQRWSECCEVLRMYGQSCFVSTQMHVCTAVDLECGKGCMMFREGEGEIRQTAMSHFCSLALFLHRSSSVKVNLNLNGHTFTSCLWIIVWLVGEREYTEEQRCYCCSWFLNSQKVLLLVKK